MSSGKGYAEPGVPERLNPRGAWNHERITCLYRLEE